MYRALSISQTILPLVTRPGFTAQVLASFARASNLLTTDGHVIMLVTRAVGDGPLTVVVEDAAPLARWQPGWIVSGDGRALTCAEDCRVCLDGAATWNSLPDYGLLALQMGDYPHRALAELDAVLAERAPMASLAALRLPCRDDATLRPYQRAAHGRITALLSAYARGDLVGIGTHVAGLAGLGPGLTPAGDDWLAGWLIGLHLREALWPETARLSLRDVAATVVRAAIRRTHTLSLSLLRAAAQGQASARWHELLSAIAVGNPPVLYTSAARVMAYGETSGSDMLAGFLCGFAR